MADVVDDSADVDGNAGAVPPASPLDALQAWLEEAHTSGAPAPSSVAFVTVGANGRPSARTVSLKRLDHDTLTFTSALWTRKATELQGNPNVALLFHWPSLGRQVHITGHAALAERDLARELFAERDLANQLQTLVSRQGTPIADLQPLRARHAHLKATMETPPDCPEDWGAIRVTPDTVELWSEAPDRLHDRWLYELHERGWKLTRIAP
ncbi:MAG TPA: pyridoxal 5'-phosphate synthase [Solirubrobacteraceae bacterium]|jgi:pyridoxamine 5'-phosphate oxidase|nr:pyridoxal 5'-phosphate synthase [Solirubrobacteraceae bacterium]